MASTPKFGQIMNAPASGITGVAGTKKKPTTARPMRGTYDNLQSKVPKSLQNPSKYSNAPPAQGSFAPPATKTKKFGSLF